MQCVVTSPPYWGLRDYGGTDAVWGGEEDCSHSWSDSECTLCGAWLGQLGLEKSPEEYVEHIVEVFSEVHRVLRDDGVLWLNLGDSYCSTAPGTMGDPLHQRGVLAGVRDDTASARRKFRPATPTGMKPKDLVGIPWMVAFALRAAGWFLRSDIVWAKSISGQIQRGTCMPESVRDRPTRAHEYLFLFAKSERYFYDYRAVLEPHTMRPQARPNGHKRRRPGAHMPEHTWSGTQRDSSEVDGDPAGRNLRTVWAVNPQPYAGAHFATFPPDLIRPCVLAGTSSRGCCKECGAPWLRQEDESWAASCSCDCAETEPCTVLDPFSGSATTGHVALANQRRYIGLDQNAAYLPLAEARILSMDPPRAEEETDDEGILDLLR
jgi:DNA modification methylase